MKGAGCYKLINNYIKRSIRALYLYLYYFRNGICMYNNKNSINSNNKHRFIYCNKHKKYNIKI